MLVPKVTTNHAIQKIVSILRDCKVPSKMWASENGGICLTWIDKERTLNVAVGPNGGVSLADSPSSCSDVVVAVDEFYFGC
jgi:hypothetical protein